MMSYEQSLLNFGHFALSFTLKGITHVVRPCRYLPDGCIESQIVHPDDAEFFGVYRVDDEGLEQWVSDHTYQSDALDAVQTIHNQIAHSVE